LGKLGVAGLTMGMVSNALIPYYITGYQRKAEAIYELLTDNGAL